LSAPFTEAELEFLKRRLDVQFGEAPRVRDGIVLKTWKSGPEKGRPRLPEAIKSLIDRGVMAVRFDAGSMPVAVFTETGLDLLRETLRGEHSFSTARFAHLRSELGPSLDQVGDGQ
jgi:hypothetical protein